VDKFERARKRTARKEDEAASSGKAQASVAAVAKVLPAEALVLRAAVDDSVRHLVRDRLLEEGLLSSPDALRIAQAIAQTGMESTNAILAHLDDESKSLLLSLTPPPDPFRGPPPLDERIVEGALTKRDREKRRKGLS
jgi:hypothetical protein